MNVKKLLKPDWRKIVIFVVLFIISSVFGRFGVYESHLMVLECHISFQMGFPFTFLEEVDCGGWGGVKYNLNYYYILSDLILWYLISCLIVWIYDKKIKKR